MENSPVYSLVLAHYFLIIFGYHGSEGYSLEIKYYDTLDVVQPEYRLSWKEYFPNMDAEERNSLCRQAAELAQLDTVNDPQAHDVMNYTERGEVLIRLIRCRTVPLAYLHYGDHKTKNVIIIAMERNKFLANKFDVRVINAPPIPCSKMLEEDPQYFEVDPLEFVNVVQTECNNDPMLRISHIRKHWRNQDRVHLCVAAKKFLKKSEHMYGPLPIFQSDLLDKPEIFYGDKGEGADAEREKHYALRCSSLPAMYLYYENLRVSTALKILLVASDAK